jgi:hypothetical protein
MIAAPLLSDHGIDVHAPDSSFHLLKRFAANFLFVWNRLPAADRAAILALWRHHKGARIEVCGKIAYHTNASLVGRCEALADCAGCGRNLRFEPAFIEAAPPEYLREIIAHELAHVLQWATGDASRILAEHGYGEDGQENLHEHLDGIVDAWGFPGRDHRVWLRRHLQATASGLHRKHVSK